MKMRKFGLLMIIFIVLTYTNVYAQNTISGKVIDAETLEPISGASITDMSDATIGAVSSAGGKFSLLVNGSEIYISYVGYRSETIPVKSKDQNDIVVKMQPQSLQMSDLVIVGSYAVDRRTPIASSTIWASEISSKLGSQEFVEIFKYTPGVHPNKQGGSWSDSEIFMRGFDNTNIAVIINGIPVNDMESRSVYWSNWASISDVSAVVQTQRGLGASKISNPSVGGTINIVTRGSLKERGGTFVYGIGADGYNKAQLTLNSGLLKHGWSFTLSGGRTWGNGYARGTSFDEIGRAHV